MSQICLEKYPSASSRIDSLAPPPRAEDYGHASQENRDAYGKKSPEEKSLKRTIVNQSALEHEEKSTLFSKNQPNRRTWGSRDRDGLHFADNPFPDQPGHEDVERESLNSVAVPSSTVYHGEVDSYLDDRISTMKGRRREYSPTSDHLRGRVSGGPAANRGAQEGSYSQTVKTEKRKARRRSRSRSRGRSKSGRRPVRSPKVESLYGGRHPPSRRSRSRSNAHKFSWQVASERDERFRRPATHRSRPPSPGRRFSGTGRDSPHRRSPQRGGITGRRSPRGTTRRRSPPREKESAHKGNPRVRISPRRRESLQRGGPDRRSSPGLSPHKRRSSPRHPRKHSGEDERRLRSRRREGESSPSDERRLRYRRLQGDSPPSDERRLRSRHRKGDSLPSDRQRATGQSPRAVGVIRGGSPVRSETEGGKRSGRSNQDSSVLGWRGSYDAQRQGGYRETPQTSYGDGCSPPPKYSAAPLVGYAARLDYGSQAHHGVQENVEKDTKARGVVSTGGRGTGTLKAAGRNNGYNTGQDRATQGRGTVRKKSSSDTTAVAHLSLRGRTVNDSLPKAIQKHGPVKPKSDDSNARGLFSDQSRNGNSRFPINDAYLPKKGKVGEGNVEEYPPANGGWRVGGEWSRRDVRGDEQDVVGPGKRVDALAPGVLRPSQPLPASVVRAQGARLMIKGTHPAVPERRIHALASDFGVVGKIEVLEVSFSCFQRFFVCTENVFFSSLIVFIFPFFVCLVILDTDRSHQL